MKKYFLFFLTIFFTLFAKSQVIKGEWYGWGNVDFVLDENNYMISLDVIEKKGQVEGNMIVYYMDEKRTLPVYGVFDKETNTLMITNIMIPMHFANLPKLGKIDIDMSFTSKLIDSRSSNQIRGYLTSKEGNGFGINFVLMRPNVGKSENDLFEPLESTKPEVFSSVPVPKTDERKVIITEDIEVDSDSLSIQLYDGSVIDNDTISVYYNNQAIVEKVQLTDKPIQINLKLDKKSKTHLFVLKAENLGSIPPNTGVMIIWDKTQRREVHFSNNLKVSSGVIFSQKY